MGTKTLNDYTCFDYDDDMLADSDSLQQVLNGEEEKNAPKRKRNVRKAIERYIERKRLKSAINDDFRLKN
jgi:hypothetical protein